ncbi:MAG: TIGR03905 family TSCPD domain-containing protein [Ruminococcaceae bacterium]|nr:TIGR03905 family TSCPD domain-containing protein [Oscillospiraceae bacterium]
MEYTRKNEGVCSRSTKVIIEDGIVKDVEIVGGCNGNIKGLIALVKGMNAQEAVERMQGITCGFKSTSCPDQLALAIKEAIAQ